MEDEDLESQGQLANIASTLQDTFDPSTTPEAQGYARRILNRYETDPYSKEQEKLFTDLEKNTREAQAALRAAREKLLARRYNPADAWFALSGALGSPTKFGTLGEMFAASANALREPTQKRFEFENEQSKEALSLQEQQSALEEKLLALKLQASGATRKSDTDLAKEALKTLGRRTSAANSSTDKAQQAVDREYAKDYVDWIQNGEPEASQALTELNSSLDSLKGVTRDADGNPVPMKNPPNLTGPVIGSISTLPKVGKWAQDVLFPKAANTQEQIESTVQRSLRPILGAQFTEKEGERLISRVYNPRLQEEVNARRVEWLINKLNVAYKNKEDARQFFAQHGTLKGFTPKHHFTVDDFMPDSTTPGEPGYKEETNPDDNAPAVTLKESDLPPGTKIYTLDEYRKLRHPVKKAEGGVVSVPKGKVPVRLDSGEIVLMDASGDTDPASLGESDAAPRTRSAPQTAAAADAQGADPAIPDAGTDDGAVARALFGATAGAGAGLAAGRTGVNAATALADLVPGRRETPAETRLLALMEKASLTPSQIAANAKRSQRQGIPATILDSGPEGFRPLAETALPQGGEETQKLLDMLKDRQAGARERTNEQINRNMKPDDFFQKEQELMTRLYGDKKKNIPSSSAPLYEAAYQQFPAVRSQQLTALMDTPSGAKAVKNARKTMQDRKLPIGKVNPVTGAVTKYSLEFLNQVKIELDDMINKADKAGTTAKAGTLKGLRDNFRNELDTATTDPATGDSPYKAARAQYETDAGVLGALRSGREEFDKLEPQQLRSKISGMNFEQKDAFRSGVAQNLYEMLNNPSTDINAARRLVGSPSMKAKLSLMFDNPNQAKVFLESLDQESKMFEQSKPLLEQKSVIDRRAMAPRGNVIQRGAQKAPTLGIFNPVMWALRLIRAKPEMKDSEAKEIIQMMRSSSPDELNAFTERLAPKFGRAAARKGVKSKVGMVGAGLGALAGAMGAKVLEADEREDPTLEGLTDEQKKMATTPAKARGGRTRFAEGGKVGMIREMLEALKKEVDPEYAAHIANNLHQRSGLTVDQAQRLLMNPDTTSLAERRAIQRPPPTVSLDLLRQQIAAQQQRYNAIHEKLQSTDPRLRDMGDRQLPQPQYSPVELERLNQSDLAAQTAMGRASQNPTPESLAQIEQLLRGLEGQLKKKRGGRMQSGGAMTTHA